MLMNVALFFFPILNFCIHLVTILQFIRSPFVEYIDCSLFSIIINLTINVFKNVCYCTCGEGSQGYILNCEKLVLGVCAFYTSLDIAKSLSKMCLYQYIHE